MSLKKIQIIVTLLTSKHNFEVLASGFRKASPLHLLLPHGTTSFCSFLWVWREIAVASGFLDLDPSQSMQNFFWHQTTKQSHQHWTAPQAGNVENPGDGTEGYWVRASASINQQNCWTVMSSQKFPHSVIVKLILGGHFSFHLLFMACLILYKLKATAML